MLAGGQWVPGTVPPAAIPTTADDLLAIHGPLLLAGTVRTADVFEQADPDEIAELRDRAALDGFAAELLADRRIRPLPDAALPPLARLALELGDDPGELRYWLDGSTVGKRIRQRIEREPLAIDRCLIALRDDPDGPLLLALALDGASHAEPVPARADDGRVQGPDGDWRTPAEHDRIAAYDRHHWRCEVCRRAGSGYGDRCAEGERLYAAMRVGR